LFILFHVASGSLNGLHSFIDYELSLFSSYFEIITLNNNLTQTNTY